MDQVFQPHGSHAAAYLDDMIIYSQDWLEHEAQVTAVLWSLPGAGIIANPAKYKSRKEETRHLGYTLRVGPSPAPHGQSPGSQSMPYPNHKETNPKFFGYCRLLTPVCPRVFNSSPPDHKPN